jgi:hypothetical protein
MTPSYTKRFHKDIKKGFSNEKILPNGHSVIAVYQKK